MRLVYLSPVQWSSFEQRPHKFVRWYHARRQAPVLWVDPYPARFPRFADLEKVRKRFANNNPMELPPPWMSVVHPYALPIEPIPGLAHLNRLLWASVVAEVSRFVGQDDAMIVIGKPSLLALQIQADFSQHPTMYDAMDDFPSFHKGMAGRAMSESERQLVSRAGTVWASSRKIHRRLSQQCNDVQLIPNGLDPTLLPVPRVRGTTSSPLVFGYVGTMADWFDWEIVVALALARPQDQVRLIGPLDVRPSMPLPANIDLRPPLPHALALQAMNTFDVGLIPFKRNLLTDSVDPIKYYEYRALGLPVLSTEFGEMANRQNTPGVFLIKVPSDVSEMALRAVAEPADPDPAFIHDHSWDAIFDAAELRYLHS